ncbi:MAG: helical backbone metal receptor [Bacteroidia bacterium]|nr:helical backbone metal receptor [Bacteroidia bacterium]MDW8133545.1 helical backbone metal receptor [Bacteroidia bacterium]
MRSVTDSLGRCLSIPSWAERIISLCPSQTETLFALGVGERIVGRTRYCIHPKGQIDSLPVVGGTKKVDVEMVQTLQPDLIIAQMEENSREDVERLSGIAPVYVTKVESYEEALESIHRLGDITGKPTEAKYLVSEIEAAFAPLKNLAKPKRVLYLTWRKPYIAAGKATYIDSIITLLGWINEAHFLPGRYPTIEDPSLVSPEIVLLCDEPYPFKEKHIPEIQILWPRAEIYCVRGDYFCWYGSRMKEAAPYLKELVERINKVA